MSARLPDNGKDVHTAMNCDKRINRAQLRNRNDTDNLDNNRKKTKKYKNQKTNNPFDKYYCNDGYYSDYNDT